MPRTDHTTHAFTLLELSVVIVIIGLIVGGVMAGQTMIRNGEVQTIISDYTKYQTAVEDFRKQYKALPGDMIDATDYWSASSACSGSTSPNGVCNGNGNGLIDPAAVASGAGENYQVWVQLRLAGRITGNYTGNAGSGAATHSIGGTNVPRGAIKASAWETGYLSPAFAGDATTYTNINYNNYFRFGKTTTNGAANGSVLKADDAKKIDAKIDDSQPQSGTVVAGNTRTCTSNTTTATPSAADRYQVSGTQPTCILYFINQF